MATTHDIPDTLRFDDRVAIVTGAGGNPGLGRIYALMLAARGAKVLVNDLGVGPDGRGQIGTGVEDVVQEIKDLGGTAIPNANSVESRDGAKTIVQAAVNEWGRVDVVINNAGIAPFALFDEISDRDIQRVVDVHLMGTIWMCRAAWPHMKRQGYGRIVNTSSTAAVRGVPYQSVYAGAKLGILGLTRSLAAEGAALGIRANVVMPTADTLAWQTMLEPEFSRKARESNVVPELVGPVTTWLAHEHCGFSGRAITARGGAVGEILLCETAMSADNPQLTLESAQNAILAGEGRRTSISPVADPDRAGQPAFRVRGYESSDRHQPSPGLRQQTGVCT